MKLQRILPSFYCTIGGSGASGDGDILSSQPELRVHNNRPIGEEFTLPGHVVPYGERIGGGKSESHFQIYHDLQI